MKIKSLRIENFRGISFVEMKELGSMVIIAGQNGSGKSCIFDAIRLLKSVYGGYQANEWQQWMGEFQINLSNRSSDFLPIFNDDTKPISILCEFELAADEKDFIKANASDLLREKIWRTIMPEAYGWGGLQFARFATQFREREPEVAKRVEEELPHLLMELRGHGIKGEIRINPGDVPRIINSHTLSVIFSTFRPKQIGVIDYHGAQRHYGRERVQGINLNIDTNEQQKSQSALYNYGQKYNNVKSEMASSYIREILAEQGGLPRASQSNLTNTLKELFETFFPDKKFDGPVPTQEGILKFPVDISDGGSHDLDDLSAGEKEILYGYLRIRSSAPRFSIILLDEPELHLNPRLIRDLPQFYRKNLGEALDNQIWLVTHSDALLREVVGRDAYNVFHMLPQSQVKDNDTQLKPLSATADLDIAITDLVGDLASYRPGGKVLVVEGGGDSDFDKKVITTLFPDFASQVNLISGTNKSKVRSLIGLLNKARVEGNVPYEFFAITDKDSDQDIPISDTNLLSWDVYHLENYFLIPKYIARVIGDLRLSEGHDEYSVMKNLKGCAKDTMQKLISHELRQFAYSIVKGSIDFGTDPNADSPHKSLHLATQRSIEKLTQNFMEKLSINILKDKETEIKDRLLKSLEDNSWLNNFRGRDILKLFTSRYCNNVSYEVFRNLILAKMKDDEYQPPGMKLVISKVNT